MSENIEYEEVKVQIPRALWQFYEALLTFEHSKETVEEWFKSFLEHACMHA